MNPPILESLFAPQKEEGLLRLIDFSQGQDYFFNIPFNGFSIKYVVEGTENYTVHGKRYPINKGEFLLANRHAEGSVEVFSPQKMVQGICIQLDPRDVSEAAAAIVRPDTPFPDLELDNFFNTDAFLEGKWSDKESCVGQILQILPRLHGGEALGLKALSKEWSFSLAEALVRDHIPIFKHLQKIPSIKSGTRKDLFRRLECGKKLLDTQIEHSLPMSEVAKAACLSEYYFFRLFKAVYGKSPYAYALENRLKFSQSLLQTGNFSVSEVALHVGFSDIFAFSKAYKRQFGHSPNRTQ